MYRRPTLLTMVAGLALLAFSCAVWGAARRQPPSVAAGTPEQPELARPVVSEGVVFEEQDGLVAVEAEHFFRQTHDQVRRWYRTTAARASAVSPDGDEPHLPGASGGAYLEILPDTRRSHADPLVKGANFSDEPGRVAVLHSRVWFNTPGRYYVWARTHSTTTEENGLHVGLDDAWPESGRRMQWTAKNQWFWDSKQRTPAVHTGVPHQLYLDVEKAGIHTVAFSMREDGFEFDRWLMTTRRDFPRPADAGPATRRRQKTRAATSPARLALVRQPQPGPRVPRWQPRDFAFRSAAKPANPFAVAFSARVVRPDGSAFTLPGFYDGEATWKVRVSPDREGRWSLVTESDERDLDGKGATFTCVRDADPNVHGALRVDPRRPRAFVWEDGTRFFPMGYECDWLWALDSDDPRLPTVNRFLGLLDGNGFNYVILDAYAHDTSWRKGKTAADDYGPPPRYAWEGSNESPDHGRLNLAYWQHFDRIIAALAARGMVAHLMIKVYNKQVRWPEKGSAEDDRFFRWLVARYAAYPNVVWDFAKEAHNERDVPYKLGRLKLLRQLDPYRRLLTVHDDNPAYESGAYNDLLDFRSDQHHNRWHETLQAQRRQREWPIVNVEFGYEHGPGGLNDKTYNVAQGPEEVCRRAWEVSVAGAYPVYYYTYSAWDVLRPDDNPPGYALFHRLKQFWDGTGYWRMQPADDLVSAGHCLADPGREYVVFLDRAAPFTLQLEGLSAPLAAEWYSPFTGRRAPAGRLAAGSASLTPPAEWGAGPVALHVGAPPGAEGK